MMSNWKYKSRNNEVCGPVTFAELAALVADGNLGDDTLVRAKHGEDWQRIDTVVGLLRAAKNLRNAADAPQPTSDSPPPDSRQPQTRASRIDKADGEQAVSFKRVAISTSVIGLFAWLAYSAYESSQRFPRPSRAQPESWTFPILGEVSALEFGLLVVDIVLVATVALWWLIRKNKTRHPNT